MYHENIGKTYRNPLNDYNTYIYLGIVKFNIDSNYEIMYLTFELY